MSSIRISRRLGKVEVDGGPYHWNFNCAGRVVRGPPVPHMPMFSRPAKLTARSMKKTYSGDMMFDCLDVSDFSRKVVRWGDL